MLCVLAVHHDNGCDSEEVFRVLYSKELRAECSPDIFFVIRMLHNLSKCRLRNGPCVRFRQPRRLALASDVQTVVIPGASHWVAEEAPEELIDALTKFRASYSSAVPSVAG